MKEHKEKDRSETVKRERKCEHVGENKSCLWKVWRYNLTVKSIIKAKWKSKVHTFWLCVCVCALGNWWCESRRGSSCWTNHSADSSKFFCPLCVFILCVCVRERERDKCMLLVYVKCVTVRVSCSPQCCASLRHTVNCQDGVTSSSWPADGVEVNGSEQEESVCVSVCVRKLLKYTNDCTLCALQFLPQLT